MIPILTIVIILAVIANVYIQQYRYCEKKNREVESNCLRLKNEFYNALINSPTDSIIEFLRYEEYVRTHADCNGVTVVYDQWGVDQCKKELSRRGVEL